MAYGIVSNSPLSNQTGRPRITSYDSGYEYSLDRYIDAKSLVQDADKEVSNAPATFAMAS